MISEITYKIMVYDCKKINIRVSFKYKIMQVLTYIILKKLLVFIND